MMVAYGCNLARLHYPVTQSNANPGVAVKVLCRCGTLIHPVLIFPGLKYVIGIGIHRNWPNANT